MPCAYEIELTVLQTGRKAGIRDVLGNERRKRLALLNGSQTDSVAAVSMESSDTLATPLNAFHLNQSLGPTQVHNRPGGLGGLNIVWPGHR